MVTVKDVAKVAPPVARVVPQGRPSYVCPLPNKRHFKSHAKPLTLTLGGVELGSVTPGISSNGKLQWSFQGKVEMDVGGVKARCQVGCNVTCIHSENLPE